MDSVPDRARFSSEAILLGKDCVSRSNCSGIRDVDPRRVQGHVHREREKCVSRSSRRLKYWRHYNIGEIYFLRFKCVSALSTQ